MHVAGQRAPVLVLNWLWKDSSWFTGETAAHHTGNWYSSYFCVSNQPLFTLKLLYIRSQLKDCLRYFYLPLRFHSWPDSEADLTPNVSKVVWSKFKVTQRSVLPSNVVLKTFLMNCWLCVELTAVLTWMKMTSCWFAAQYTCSLSRSLALSHDFAENKQCVW